MTEILKLHQFFWSFIRLEFQLLNWKNRYKLTKNVLEQFNVILIRWHFCFIVLALQHFCFCSFFLVGLFRSVNATKSTLQMSLNRGYVGNYSDSQCINYSLKNNNNKSCWRSTVYSNRERNETSLCCVCAEFSSTVADVYCNVFSVENVRFLTVEETWQQQKNIA